MISEKTKKIYNWVLENVAKKKYNDNDWHTLVFENKRANFHKHLKKINTDEIIVYKYELDDEASEQDYLDYINYVLAIYGMAPKEIQELKNKIK